MRTVLAAVAVFVAVPAGTASAHASLIGSEPSYAATMQTPPVSVRLLFDNLVEPGLVKVRLKDDAGVEVGKAVLIGERTPRADVSFTLPAHGDGKWVIYWTSFAFDGHVVSGTVPYTVDPNGTAGTGTITDVPVAPTDTGSTNRIIDIVDIQLRFMTYIALAALAGALLWWQLLRRATGSGAAVVLRIANRVAVPAAWVAAGIALARGGVATWRLLDGGATPRDLLPLLWNGQLGGYILAAVALVLAAVWRGGLRSALAAASGAALLAGLGHSAAAAAPGIGSILMAGHLVSAAIWVGFVGVLAYAVTDRGFHDAEDRWSSLTDALRSGGQILIACTAVLAVTGMRAAAVYGDGLPDGRWGLTLAAKLVLVAGAAAIGGWHHLTHRRGRHLRTSTLIIEATALVLVLTVAAVLSVTPI
jgi:copper transport protein